MTDDLIINIQSATVNQIDILCRLYDNCKKVLLEKNIHQWTKDYPTRGMLVNDIHQQKLYVAYFMDEIVAAIVLNQQIPQELSIIAWKVADERSILVERLAVHPDFFGKGIGEKMMVFAEKKVVENKQQAIRLQVYKSNKRAKAFYQKIGYYCLGGMYYQGWKSPFYCFEKQFK